MTFFHYTPLTLRFIPFIKGLDLIELMENFCEKNISTQSSNPQTQTWI